MSKTKVVKIQAHLSCHVDRVLLVYICYTYQIYVRLVTFNDIIAQYYRTQAHYRNTTV